LPLTFWPSLWVLLPYAFLVAIRSRVTVIFPRLIQELAHSVSLLAFPCLLLIVARFRQNLLEICLWTKRSFFFGMMQPPSRRR
jgi:hypothetical protein